MSIEKRAFGTLSDGRPAFLYTITNPKGASVSLTDYGASVVSARVQDGKGQLRDIVAGGATASRTMSGRPPALARCRAATPTASAGQIYPGREGVQACGQQRPQPPARRADRLSPAAVARGDCQRGERGLFLFQPRRGGGLSGQSDRLGQIYLRRGEPPDHPLPGAVRPRHGHQPDQPHLL